MCGRYRQTADVKTLQKRFGFDKIVAALAKRYNIAPGQPAAVVAGVSKRQLQGMNWGLVPAWAKDPRIGYRMINARAETVAEKPAYRKAFERRRCLVLADGFYEWKRDGGVKIPICFARKDRGPFAFAGIWERWHDPHGSETLSFSIVTTEANEFVKPVHDRMPVILAPSQERAWLDPKSHKDRLHNIMAPRPWDGMESFPVSKRVNSADNDDASIAEPAETGGGQLELTL